MKKRVRIEGSVFLKLGEQVAPVFESGPAIRCGKRLTNKAVFDKRLRGFEFSLYKLHNVGDFLECVEKMPGKNDTGGGAEKTWWMPSAFRLDEKGVSGRN